MLEKIQEDVNDILETLIEEHSDVFQKYEMSDDFKEIRLYETPGSIGKYAFARLEPDIISRIESLFGLYHSVKTNDSAEYGRDYIFEIIGSESWRNKNNSRGIAAGVTLAVFSNHASGFFSQLRYPS